MIGRSVGRYRIVSKLGEGGMGSVWKAVDPLLGRTIALKFLPQPLADSASARRRFLREARAASRLRHTGIATVFDTGEVDGQVYIAMQLVGGETLSDSLTCGPLPIDEAIRIAHEVAAALEHAHDMGILHRDITSRNVVLDEQGHAVVVDFGLASSEGRAKLTDSGIVMGTIAYIAPEILQGKPASVYSDLYGLGAILYEMLTGRTPFIGERQETLLYAVVHEQPQSTRSFRAEIPETLDRLVLRLLSKIPAHRPANAQELHRELAEIQSQPAPDSAQRSGEPSQRVATNAPPRPHKTMSSASSSNVLTAVSTSSQRFQLKDRARSYGVVLAVAVVLIAASTTYGLWKRLVMPSRQPRFKSVAVLSLNNSSPRLDETTYLADGLGARLATQLFRALSLNVMPWVISSRYDTSNENLEEIAEALNVDAVIMGSFQKNGNQIQINLALVDPRTGHQHWAEEFLEPSGDLFTLQGRFAMSVARQLSAHLSGEQERELNRPASISMEAYEHYLRGVDTLRAGGRLADEAAYRFFDKAVSIDHQLAEAYVGLGAVHHDRYFYGWGGGFQNLQFAAANYQHALRLEPRLHAARSGLLRVLWERGETEACLKVGREILDSGDNSIEATLVRAEAYLFGGLADRAIPLFEELIRVAPGHASAHWHLVLAHEWAGRPGELLATGNAYFSRFGADPEILVRVGGAHRELGNHEEAQLFMDRALELEGQGLDPGVYIGLGFDRLDLGDNEGALAFWTEGLKIVDERLAAHPDNHRMRMRRAHLLSLLGEWARAEAECERIIEVWPGNPVLAVHVALVYVRLGQYEHALEWLGAGLQKGFYAVEFDQELARLNKDFIASEGFLEYHRANTARGEELRTRY